MVALYLVEYLVNNPFKSEGMVVRTEEIQDSARLVSLVAHTRLNTGIFIALLPYSVLGPFLQDKAGI